MNRSLNILWKIFATISLIALISGCGTVAIDEKEPLLVEFTDRWSDYTLLIAQQKGFFKEHKVNVKPVYYEVFSQAVPDLTAGQLDGGLFPIRHAINVANYTDVKVVAVYDNGGLNTIVATPEIKTISDLKNKRVGVPIGTTYELLVNEMLKSANLSTADIELVDVTPENVPLSLGETIDAGFVYEPYTSQSIADGNTLLITTDNFIGLYPSVIVFRQSITEQREDDVRNFLKAWFEAVEFSKKNPAEVQRIIANFYQVPESEIFPDDQLSIYTLEDNLSMFQQTNEKFRSIYDTAKTNADFLIRIGVLTTSPDINALIVPNYLK